MPRELVVLSVLLAAASASPLSRPAPRSTELARPTSRGLFDAVTRRAFTAADYDANGFINKQEIYGLVLTAYVYANRAAPIEPPSARDDSTSGAALEAAVPAALAASPSCSPGGARRLQPGPHGSLFLRQ